MKETEGMLALNLDKLKQAAENYSKACGVPCRILDNFGSTKYLAAEHEHVAICELAATAMPSACQGDPTDSSCRCENAHLYGLYQAERFGGRYIYFCPLGLTHWVSPIYQDETVVASLLGGPVNMVDPEEFLLDDLITKNGVHPDFLSQLHDEIKLVPVVPTDRVNAMSELLYLVAASLSDESFKETEHRHNAGKLQEKLWEQIDFLSRFTHKDEKDLTYPIEKESQLLERIEVGDKAASQKILNEILGHIFFSSSGSIEIMRARVMELVVLLSRAAIRGGADVEQIFGLNYTYLNKINTFRNIDEIAYWLSGIMARFTDQVFNLTNVKHADVIFRAIDYVKKNYMNRITLEETAAHVFLSPAYFSRVFKEELGENFNSYVNKTRVQAAARLLLNDTTALVDISSMTGFETQSYFSKVFKRVMGVTPGKYRESRGKARPAD